MKRTSLFLTIVYIEIFQPSRGGPVAFRAQMRSGAAFILRHALSTILIIGIQLQANGQSPVGSSQADSISLPPTNVIQWTNILRLSSAAAMPTSVQMSFALFEASSGGSPVWSETQTVSIGSDGYYSVLLGAGTQGGLPGSIFRMGGARWLERHCTDNNPSSVLNDCAQQYPLDQRILLPMVPYAFAAMDADMLGGRFPEEYITRRDVGKAITNQMQATISDATNGLAKHPQTGGNAGSLPVWRDNSTLDNSIIVQRGTSVGIGTVNPQSTLDVNGPATIRGNLGLVALTLPNGGPSESPGLQLTAQNLSGNSKIPVAQSFIWQVQPQGTGSESPSSVLALLYSDGTHPPASTGFSISPTGNLSFAAGQQFPSEIGNSSMSQSPLGIDEGTAYLVNGPPSAEPGKVGANAALKANQFPGSDVGVQINECLSAVGCSGGKKGRLRPPH